MSAPKRRSLMAMIGGDERIVEAHDRAVRTTLGWERSFDNSSQNKGLADPASADDEGDQARRGQFTLMCRGSVPLERGV